MNRTQVPIFRDGPDTYHADRCRPLVEAANHGAVRLVSLVRGHYPGRELPANCLPGVKTVGFWDATTEQDWGLDWHRNEGIEITYLETGSLAFAADQSTYRLHAGDVTVTRPWQRHCVGNPNVSAGRLHWLILDLGVRRPNQEWKWPSWVVLCKQDLSDLTNLLRHNEHPVWKSSTEIRECFSQLGRTVERVREGDTPSRLTVKVNELFVLLLELLKEQSLRLEESLSTSRRTVELFLADLRGYREHLAEEWTVEKMAQSCGLGVTRFIHYTKEIVNMTPLQYLGFCRLRAASSMLREAPGMNITAVALACGFSSGQYFANKFRQLYGHSPREHRRIPPASSDAF